MQGELVSRVRSLPKFRIKHNFLYHSLSVVSKTQPPTEKKLDHHLPALFPMKQGIHASLLQKKEMASFAPEGLYSSDV